MKKFLPFIAAFFLLSAPCFAQVQMSEFWADTLNKTLLQEFGDEDMNGLAGAVVFSDGSVWSGTQGNHDFVPLSTEFLYDIGSNTKSMVATVIMLLEEEGQLTLDDTLYSFIPPVNNVPNGITLKQLLQHRSGVFSYTEHPDFFDAIDADDNRFWHPDTILNNYLQAPHFTAGAQFRYSNTGYLLLGKVIEAVENKPLNVVLKERIFQPLELDNVFLDVYDSYTQVKTGSWLSPSFYYPTIPSFMSAAWAAGGVVATPEDFAHYAHGLLRGDLLTEASMLKMREGTPVWGEKFGLGIIEHSLDGKTYLGHGGTTLQNSEMEYSLESDFSLVLFNLDNGYFNETRRARNTFLRLLEYIEEVHEQVVSVDETTPYQTNTRVYPNPSVDQMTIQLDEMAYTENLTLEVRDLTGRVVWQEAMYQTNAVLQKTQIGPGMFILNVMKDGHIAATKRIVFN